MIRAHAAASKQPNQRNEGKKKEKHTMKHKWKIKIFFGDISSFSSNKQKIRTECVANLFAEKRNKSSKESLKNKIYFSF